MFLVNRPFLSYSNGIFMDSQTTANPHFVIFLIYLMSQIITGNITKHH